MLGYYTEEEVEYEDIKPKIEPEDYEEYGGSGDAGDEDAAPYNEEMQDTLHLLKTTRVTSKQNKTTITMGVQMQKRQKKNIPFMK